MELSLIHIGTRLPTNERTSTLFRSMNMNPHECSYYVELIYMLNLFIAQFDVSNPIHKCAYIVANHLEVPCS